MVHEDAGRGAIHSLRQAESQPNNCKPARSAKNLSYLHMHVAFVANEYLTQDIRFIDPTQGDSRDTELQSLEVALAISVDLSFVMMEVN